MRVREGMQNVCKRPSESNLDNPKKLTIELSKKSKDRVECHRDEGRVTCDERRMTEEAKSGTWDM